MTGKFSLNEGCFPTLSKAPDLDLDGDLDRWAQVVAELMATPLEIDLSLPAASTKAAPGPDAKPSFRR